jgi:hypothetical protein
MIKVGEPRRVETIVALAATAYCNLRAVDHQTAAPLDKIDMGIIQPMCRMLLSEQ